MEFNGRVYYPDNAEHGKRDKQVNQFHILSFFIVRQYREANACNRQQSDSGNAGQEQRKAVYAQSISPANMIPPNTNFEMSVQYFPISANSAFFLSSVIVPVVCLCKYSIFEEKGKAREQNEKENIYLCRILNLQSTGQNPAV